MYKNGDVVNIDGLNYLFTKGKTDKARELFLKTYKYEPEIVWEINGDLYTGPINDE